MSPFSTLERRDSGMIIVLGVFTCGISVIFWYYAMYQDLEKVGGRTPTGNSFILDFILTIVTCGLYGIWCDYKISDQLNELQKAHQCPGPDTTMVAVGLDVMAYLVGLTNLITSAIQQDQLNKLSRFVTERDGVGMGGGALPAHSTQPFGTPT